MDLVYISKISLIINAYIFRSSTGTDTTKFLHVATDTEQKTQMYTKGTHISTSFTRSPEDGKVTIVVEFEQLGLVNSTNTQLTLNSGNKRGTLEKSTSKSFNGLIIHVSSTNALSSIQNILTNLRQLLFTINGIVKAERIQTYSLPAPC